MTPGPAAAVDWVVRELPRTQEPIGAEELIIKISITLGWPFSPEQIQEFAEKWHRPFVTRLVRHYNEYVVVGRPTRFEFNTSSEHLIQGASYVEDSDSRDLAETKESRSHADTYLMFLHSLRGRQFEGVCRGVLLLLGCEQPEVTPKGNDQGIDFHGSISMHGRLDRRYPQPSIDKAMRTWVVGQAKQIEGNVGTGEIRDFVGALEIFRVGVSADDGKALSTLRMKPFDSVWRLFMTTGRFSRDSWKLVRNLGLVGMDGEAVAALLADHRVGDQAACCDRDTFNAWTASQLPPGG